MKKDNKYFYYKLIRMYTRKIDIVKYVGENKEEADDKIKHDFESGKDFHCFLLSDPNKTYIRHKADVHHYEYVNEKERKKLEEYFS